LNRLLRRAAYLASGWSGIFAFAVLTFAHGALAQAQQGLWHGRIMTPGQDRIMSSEELFQHLADSDVIVMGEKHYTAAVQSMEAAILRGTMSAATEQTHMTVGWEFLNRRDRAQIDQLFDQVSNGSLTPEDFVSQTQNTPNAVVYAPVIAAVRNLRGSLLPTNLSRAEKAPVTQGGITALDPALLPPGYGEGSDHYRQRFREAMGDHVPADKIANYFDAQCLTDDVMAWSLEEGTGLKFLIAGSFHTDYRDGAVERLKTRLPTAVIKSVTIIDAADFAEPDLLPLLIDSRWGPLADYVVFVNEPQNPM